MNHIIAFENYALAAFVVSLISLGLSAYAIKISLKKLKIEQAREHDRQDKARCANFTTKFNRLGQHGCYELIIENNGASEARDVTVMLNEKPILELKSVQPEISSIPKIGPNSNVSYQWLCAGNPRPPYHLEITWSDDSKKSGYYGTTLIHPITSF